MNRMYFYMALPFFLCAMPALAYIGPGAGLGALGAVLGFIIAILVAILIVLSWPIRLLLRKRKKKKQSIDTNGDLD
jgi:hypothetical protein